MRPKPTPLPSLSLSSSLALLRQLLFLLGDAPSRPIFPDGLDPGDSAGRSMTGGLMAHPGPRHATGFDAPPSHTGDSGWTRLSACSRAQSGSVATAVCAVRRLAPTVAMLRRCAGWFGWTGPGSHRRLPGRAGGSMAGSLTPAGWAHNRTSPARGCTRLARRTAQSGRSWRVPNQVPWALWSFP